MKNIMSDFIVMVKIFVRNQSIITSRDHRQLLHHISTSSLFVVLTTYDIKIPLRALVYCL
jgi:hypothetical protein